MQDLTMTGVLPYFNNSQVKLATTLGVSRQAVNTWLKNDKIPPLRMYQIRDILKEIEMKIEMKIENVSE